MDGADIKRWRSMHRFKQAALAEMLGVTQATVSKWESGLWQPTKTMALRLSDVMSGIHEGKLAVELACLAPQQQLKQILRGQGMQFMGASAGFGGLWPQVYDLIGRPTRDLLANEAASYCEQGDYLREAAAGELLMVTAVSHFMMAGEQPADADQRMRWHAVVRHIDGELIHEVIYEPCAAGTPVGFEKVLRRSDIVFDFE